MTRNEQGSESPQKRQKPDVVKGAAASAEQQQQDGVLHPSAPAAPGTQLPQTPQRVLIVASVEPSGVLNAAAVDASAPAQTALAAAQQNSPFPQLLQEQQQQLQAQQEQPQPQQLQGQQQTRDYLFWTKQQEEQGQVRRFFVQQQQQQQQPHHHHQQQQQGVAVLPAAVSQQPAVDSSLVQFRQQSTQHVDHHTKPSAEGQAVAVARAVQGSQAATVTADSEVAADAGAQEASNGAEVPVTAEAGVTAAVIERPPTAANRPGAPAATFVPVSLAQPEQLPQAAPAAAVVPTAVAQIVQLPAAVTATPAAVPQSSPRGMFLVVLALTAAGSAAAGRKGAAAAAATAVDGDAVTAPVSPLMVQTPAKLVASSVATAPTPEAAARLPAAAAGPTPAAAAAAKQAALAAASNGLEAAAGAEQQQLCTVTCRHLTVNGPCKWSVTSALHKDGKTASDFKCMSLRAGFSLCMGHLQRNKLYDELQRRLETAGKFTDAEIDSKLFIFVDVTCDYDETTYRVPFDSKQCGNKVRQIAAVTADGSSRFHRYLQVLARSPSPDGSAATAAARLDSEWQLRRSPDGFEAAAAAARLEPVSAPGHSSDGAEGAQAAATRLEVAPGQRQSPRGRAAAAATTVDPVPDREQSPVAELPSTAAAAAGADPAAGLQELFSWAQQQQQRQQQQGETQLIPQDIVFVCQNGFCYTFSILAQHAEMHKVRMPNTLLADMLFWNKVYGGFSEKHKLADLADMLLHNGTAGAFNAYRQEHGYAQADVEAMRRLVPLLAQQRAAVAAAQSRPGSSSSSSSADKVWKRQMLALATSMQHFVARLGLDVQQSVDV